MKNSIPIVNYIAESYQLAMKSEEHRDVMIEIIKSKIVDKCMHSLFANGTLDPLRDPGLFRDHIFQIIGDLEHKVDGVFMDYVISDVLNILFKMVDMLLSEGLYRDNDQSLFKLMRGVALKLNNTVKRQITLERILELRENIDLQKPNDDILKFIQNLMKSRVL